MRSAVMTSPNGLEVRGIAGTYVVLLAFNCPKALCRGLIGFAIQRRDHETREVRWLSGQKSFGSDRGAAVSTEQQPIQKFHWGDYTTRPGRRYTYTVFALTGSPGALRPFDSVAVDVVCENPEAVGQRGHAVHFNRSAAASQAFVRRFPALPNGEVVDPNARAWLSRGLAESLIAFIGSAASGESLHLFLYELEKEEFLEALAQARTRGVKLEILFDSLLNRSGDGPSLKAKPQITKFGLDADCRGRTGAGLGISHNKFMVLCGRDGQPKAVWTGSTNFTDAGIYGQSNVGHAVADAGLAKLYFDWHRAIWNSPDTAAKKSRELAMGLSPVPAPGYSGTKLVLSPRKSTEALTECARLIGDGKRMVCFTAPFALHDDIEAALTAAPAHVFGLLNTRNCVEPAMYQAPNTQLAAAASLDKKSVLERWQGRLRAESMHHSGIYIHTKLILVDPLSEHPFVITGSANFSTNSSKNNDENQLFIAGETEVADVYLGEFMRMFDHYYFRDFLRYVRTQRKVDPKAGFLDETDGWTARYFDGGEREALRRAFFD